MDSLGLHQDEDDFVEKDPTGRYLRYNEILGRGGFKTVYKGFDEVNGTEVAWNQVNIEKYGLDLHDQLDRLYSEVNLLKSLKHENIMKFFYHWVDDETKNINMITELFTSGSLRKYREKHKNVDLKAIKNWARQILKGLCYLHSHNPPIIHRDLKCDNVFVNGNNGQVKIGDLGLAIVLNQNQRTVPSVMIGTPQFIAPELYEDGEYNELVDIYSFGMCMLELVTCEYPYSECKSTAQFYKKVVSGIKPACLGKVQDPQVLKFIEKCLVPASKRLSAVELLNDPFLATGNSKELGSSASLLLPSLLKSVSCSKDLDTNHKNCFGKDLVISSLELQRFSQKFALRLRGEKVVDDIERLSFTLCIVDQLCGGSSKIEFPFCYGSDTSDSIAEELIEQFDLSNKDAAIIAEMIDAIIVKLVPHWTPLSGGSSTSSTSNGFPSEIKISMLQLQTFSNKLEFRLKGETTDDDTVSFLLRIVDQQRGGSKTIEFPFYYKSDTSTSVAEEMIEQINFPNTDVSIVAEMIDASITKLVPGISKESSKQDFRPLPEMEQETQGSIGSNSTTTSLDRKSTRDDSGNSVSPENRDQQDDDELKRELDSIDTYYSRCFQDLMSEKEEAIRNAKKKWMTMIKIPVN